MQPIVAFWSDRCSSSFGRRRPYLVFGAIFCIIALTCFAHAELISGPLASISISGRVPVVVQMVASAGLVALAIAIQPLQMATRALIVDQTPLSEQGSAALFATYMMSCASILGLTIQSLPLSKMLGIVSWSDLQISAALTSATVAATTITTCLFQDEGPCDLSLPSVVINGGKQGSGIRNFLRYFSKDSGFAPEVRRICLVQMFSWMGWFPFLYYSSG